MKQITDVIYDEKPKDVTVYNTSVYVIKSCEEIQISDGQSNDTYTKYKCNVEIYDVSEYIDKIQQNNAILNTQIDDVQLALTEVYEMILNMS